MFLRPLTLGGFAALVLLAACGSSKLAGNGGECFVANDCQSPLVCVQQRNGTRICTDNLDSVVGEVPPEAGPPARDAGEQNEGGGGGPGDAATGEPKDSGGGGGDQ